MFFKLLYMRQLMPDPFTVIDELLRGSIMQQNSSAQHHSHFILLQLPGRYTCDEGIFFNIIFQVTKLNAAQ